LLPDFGAALVVSCAPLFVVSTGDVFRGDKILDMTMLVVVGSQERTEAEYGAFVSKSSFRLNCLPTKATASVVEAIPT